LFSRFGLYAIAAAAVLLGLAYLDARLDRANEADALEKRVAEMAAEAAEKDAIAAALETKLQAVRMEATEINRKWSDLRAEKNRPVCRLDADVVGLLKSASAPDAR
jgi:ABC-type protease/lipase transport system fused ATPase/permease subunit